MQIKDYYQILGVNFGATDTEIKDAYKTLARKFHPDVNLSDGAEAKFKEINEAYEILSDKNKREIYNKLYSSNKQNKINKDENLNIFDPRGNIHRLNFFFVNLLSNSIFNKLEHLISVQNSKDITIQNLAIIVIILLIVYIQICSIIKRLNDIKCPRWFAFLILIPIVNIALGIYLLFTPANYMSTNKNKTFKN